MSWETTKKQLEQELDEVRRSYGDLRLKIHLASMEAKAYFTELEPKLEEAGEKVEKLTREAAGVTRDLLSEVKQGVRRLKASMDETRQGDEQPRT